jgi:2'-5' RNA ligase
LVPTCFLRAHVTVLPPRPAAGDTEHNFEELKRRAACFHPFEVELAKVSVFEHSDVIYLSLGKGEEELRAMHRALNHGGLCFCEFYSYHPHITLAQELKPDQLDELIRVAEQRWDEYRGPRSFRVEKLHFVQATRSKTWTDLAEFELAKESGLKEVEPEPQLV